MTAHLSSPSPVLTHGNEAVLTLPIIVQSFAHLRDLVKLSHMDFPFFLIALACLHDPLPYQTSIQPINPNINGSSKLSSWLLPEN